METSRRNRNNAFQEIGKPRNRNAVRVSDYPLFIGARENENKTREGMRLQTRTLCLRHGERFHWKSRCASCRYLIRFHARRVN